MYFKGDDGYQIYIVFPPMLNLVTVDSKKNVTNLIWTVISPEKVKPFDSNIVSTMSCLANGLFSSVLVKLNYSSLCNNFKLNLYIVYQLNKSY